MEDGMPRIHIAATGASICFLLAVTLGSAAAQSVDDGPVGKPLPLLQFTQHKGKTKLQPRSKLAATAVRKKKAFEPQLTKRVTTKPRVVAKSGIAKTHVIAKAHVIAKTHIKPHRAFVEARPAPAAVATVASTAMPKDAWPTNAATPTLAMDQPVPSVTTEPTVDTDPNQIVIGSHSVQTALPNGLAQAPPPVAPKKTMVAAAATSTPVVHAMVVRAEPQNASAPSPIGSASWMAHMLAALGGAITAGAVAWFLIKPAPERAYEDTYEEA
jgi:hypothetical protein